MRTAKVEIVIEKVWVNKFGMWARVDFVARDGRFELRESADFEYEKFVEYFKEKFPRRIPTKREIHAWAKEQIMRQWLWFREQKLDELRRATMEKRFLDTFKTLKTFDEDCAKRQGGGQE